VQTRQQAPAEPVLGLDLGGSSVKWVRMDGGAVTASGRVPTPRTGVDDVLAALVGVVAAQPQVRSVGLAAAAIIDAAAGRLVVDERAGFRPVRIADPQALKQGLAAKARTFTPPVRLAIDDGIVEGEPVVVARVHECDRSAKPCRVTATGTSYLRAYDGDYAPED
jgi:hypothetical protein